MRDVETKNIYHRTPAAGQHVSCRLRSRFVSCFRTNIRNEARTVDIATASTQQC